LEEREKTPRYEGYVTKTNREGKMVWSVKITTEGDLHDRLAYLDRKNLPSWIDPAMHISFNLVSIGTKSDCVFRRCE
jgi:hypothetical protein